MKRACVSGPCSDNSIKEGSGPARVGFPAWLSSARRANKTLSSVVCSRGPREGRPRQSRAQRGPYDKRKNFVTRRRRKDRACHADKTFRYQSPLIEEFGAGTATDLESSRLDPASDPIRQLPVAGAGGWSPDQGSDSEDEDAEA